MVVPLPEGELLRKAVRWISEQQEMVPRPSLAKLLDEAGERFNLSPKDSQFLYTFFIESRKKDE